VSRFDLGIVRFELAEKMISNNPNRAKPSETQKRELDNKASHKLTTKRKIEANNNPAVEARPLSNELYCPLAPRKPLTNRRKAERSRLPNNNSLNIKPRSIES